MLPGAALLTPEAFQMRYRASLSPQLLDFGLGAFVQFPADELAATTLSAEDQLRLAEVGMPRAAAPYVGFGHVAPGTGPDLPDGYFCIGHTGNGDPLCIDQDSGEVVYLFHEDGMKYDFINSSLAQFQECLCIYQEHRSRGALADCFTAMCAIDAVLEEEQGFWVQEIADEL